MVMEGLLDKSRVVIKVIRIYYPTDIVFASSDIDYLDADTTAPERHRKRE
jgi:hypothetical protein